MASLPANVHVSTHPCVQAKLSQLRSRSTSAKEVKALVHEISLLLGAEALASVLKAAEGPKDTTPLGFEYNTTTVNPDNISLVPILRSGLGMVQAIESLLPNPVPVHHLGLYREPSTLEPVEYYNNLPNHQTQSSPSATSAGNNLSLILDPVIATGGTCSAAIQTLREWGTTKVVVLSVLGAKEGVRRVAEEWSEATEIWVAGLDADITPDGMLRPGLGDVGDRLFLTLGK